MADVNTGPSVFRFIYNKLTFIRRKYKSRGVGRDTSDPTWADVGLANVYKAPSPSLLRWPSPNN